MKRALVLMACLVMAACTSKSPPPPASTEGDHCIPPNPGVSAFVYGWVADAGTTALAGAKVTARMLAHQHELNMTTDAAGCYWLDLGVGQPHDVTASKAGFKSSTTRSVALDTGEHERLNFHLAAA